jgi:Sec-independent protein translocase protein TatA
MFGKLGVPELFITLAVPLLIFGPRKLGELGKAWETEFVALDPP